MKITGTARLVIFLAITSITGVLPAATGTPKPGIAAYLIEPVDGQRLPRTFRVVFGLSGMGVAPAGVERENTGHHHLLIDMSELPDLDKPLPATEHIRHFGGGQTEATITLEPGTHTLQLLLGDHAHIPHQPPVISEKITVIVE